MKGFLYLDHVILLNFDQREITEKCEVTKFKNYYKYNGKENAGPVKGCLFTTKMIRIII